jgi:hypothetical protein
MNQIIGESAGKLWEILKKKNRVGISQLPKLMKANETLTYQALGWLAREGKVKYDIVGKKTMISLMDGE